MKNNGKLNITINIISNQINQLLWLNYSYVKRNIEEKCGCNQNPTLKGCKLCYLDKNNYMAHSSIYELLHSNDLNNITIQHLNQQININKEYNTTKKQKINNNNINNKREYFIQQLISTSSSSSSTSSSHQYHQH